MEARQNVKEAIELLENKPLHATAYERIFILDRIKSDKKQLSVPLRFSHMLHTLLSEVSVPIMEYDLVAGRIPDRELTAEEESLYQAFIKHPDSPYRRIFCDFGHISYDWDFLLAHGLVGLKKRAEGFLKAQADPEKRDFLTAQCEVYDALIQYLHRYADKARELGNAALADALCEAADEKPHSFRGALQLLYTVGFIDCAYVTKNPTLTLGFMDTLLLPYYEKELAEGTLTREAAKELILDFYCKHNLMMGRGEHQVGNTANSTGFSRICNFDAPQYLLLGGRDGVTALTSLFAECIEPRFKNPVVVFYYYTDMASEHPVLWKTLTDKALAGSSMMFYHQDSMKAAYRRTGLTEAQYEGCYHFGCNWAAPSTRAAWGQAGPKALLFEAPMSDAERERIQKPYPRSVADGDWPEVFMTVLSSLADGEFTMTDIENAFFSVMEEFIDHKLTLLRTDIAIRQRRPAAVMTYSDCFFPRTAELGGTHAALSELFYELMPFRMFGTVADCFIVTDALVFREKKLTARTLLDAANANFEGYEELLAMIRRVPKYGSDTEEANAWAKRLCERYLSLIAEKNKPALAQNSIFLEPCMQSDTWHLKLGAKFGATVGGRAAGEPFSQNTRPSNGSCPNGITGMLNSMLSVTPYGLVSGALNLDVQKSLFRGEERHAVFAAMLASYFDRGGLHAQISVTDADELRAAKADPDSHRDLRVRITGYSAVFVDTCEALQNDLIARLED